MSEGMVELHPYRGGSAPAPTPAGKRKRGTSSDLIQRVNVVHFWEAASPMWKNGAKVLAFVFAVIVFLNAPTFGGGVVCILPVGLLAGMLLLAFVWTGLIMSRMDTPEMLASAYTTRRGEALDVIYRQAFKKDTDFPVIKISLVLREWVRYSCGTNTCTDQHDLLIDEQMFTGERVSAGELLHKEATFKIPDDAMHSFQANDNKLNWLIIVELQIANFPDLKETFAIEVLPEVSAA